jgi:hypothetical protein
MGFIGYRFMAKLIIDNDLIAEEYFADARLVGIQCPLEPHRLAWHINQLFLYDFRYQSGSEVLLTKKGRPLRYAVYQYEEKHLQITHLIYANQYDGEYLLPELKHFDYIWLLKGEQLYDNWIKLLLHEIKKIDHAQMVMELSSDKIKNKTRLVL